MGEPSPHELDARNRSGGGGFGPVDGGAGAGSAGFIAETIEAINLQIQGEQPGTAEALAGEWATLAETLEGIASDLRTADEVLVDWQSPAAEAAYRDRFDQLVTHLDDMAAAASTLSSGLSELAEVMRAGQARMQELYDDYVATMAAGSGRNGPTDTHKSSVTVERNPVIFGRWARTASCLGTVGMEAGRAERSPYLLRRHQHPLLGDLPGNEAINAIMHPRPTDRTRRRLILPAALPAPLPGRLLPRSALRRAAPLVRPRRRSLRRHAPPSPLPRPLG